MIRNVLNIKVCISAMDPFRLATEKFLRAELIPTQAPLVELYEDLRVIPSDDRTIRVFRKLLEFGISGATKEYFKTVPMTHDQWKTIADLLTVEPPPPPVTDTLPKLVGPELGVHMEKSLFKRLYNGDDPNEVIKTFVEVMTALNDETLTKHCEPILNRLESLGWTPVGFLHPIDSDYLIRELNHCRNGLTVSGRCRLQTIPIVLEVIRALIADLEDEKKDFADSLTEFQQTIEAIVEEQPIVRKEIETILELLSKAHLTTRKLLVRGLKREIGL